MERILLDLEQEMFFNKDHDILMIWQLLKRYTMTELKAPFFSLLAWEW